MIKCYLSLVIIVGIQQTCFSHSTNIQQKISALRHKLKKEIQQDYQSKAEKTQDFIDNYDLIISEPAEMTTVKPILQVGHHHHHRHRKHHVRKTDAIDPPVLRSGVDLNITTTTNDPETIAIVEDSSPILVGKLSSTVVLTTASNPTNDTFEANVKLLEAKVEEAIKNLTNYVRETGTKRAEDLLATTTDDPKQENLNPTNNEYISQLDTEKAEDLVATTTHDPRKRKSKVSPAIPFFRRFNYLNDKERNKPQKWVHCLDLISPRLQGMNNDGPKNASSLHRDVQRLAQLLSTNVTKFTSQDMVSILTQISKIRIRMYQWNPQAITTILNAIIKGPVHNFKNLKTGIHVLFNNWHLDTSMMSVFLKEIRIFRPPCIEISDKSGFTKKPGGIIWYPKPDKPKKKRHDPDKSCHSKEAKYNNDP